jgi:hypothetical protein
MDTSQVAAEGESNDLLGALPNIVQRLHGMPWMGLVIMSARRRGTVTIIDSM